MITNFKDLRIYEKSYELCLKICKLYIALPKEERFILIDQIKRASLSIPLNIAEGYGKKESKAEFKRFLRMSLGSCNEVEVLLDMMYDLKYIDKAVHDEFVKGYIEVRKQIYSTIEKWK